MSDDFLKGYSQGMTGSTGGLPSQSVLEKMGRDAASNQWNNNNVNVGGAAGGGYGVQRNGIPITTVLYQAGKKIEFKKLLRHFLIASALIVGSTLVNSVLPPWGDWVLAIPYFAGMILMFWVFLRVPLYVIARLGSLFESKEKTDT